MAIHYVVIVPVDLPDVGGKLEKRTSRPHDIIETKILSEYSSMSWDILIPIQTCFQGFVSSRQVKKKNFEYICFRAYASFLFQVYLIDTLKCFKDTLKCFKDVFECSRVFSSYFSQTFVVKHISYNMLYV